MSIHPDVAQTPRTTHPEWCAGGHHCTADRLSNGEHASVPEVWDTNIGRLIATRTARTGGGYLEVRLVVALPDHEDSAQQYARLLIAATYQAVRQTASCG